MSNKLVLGLVIACFTISFIYLLGSDLDPLAELSQVRRAACAGLAPVTRWRDPWTREIRDFFLKVWKGFLWLRLSSRRLPVKKYLFCVLWPAKDISRWFRKVDESCLLSMKMNGQDFSKKQSLTKIHPSCLTGRPVNSISCTWLFFLHQSNWRVYHILTFYIFRQGLRWKLTPWHDTICTWT